MRKEDVQMMLEQFGYSISINRRIGETAFYHMIHTKGKKLIEYTVNETLGLIKTVWAFGERALKEVVDTSELESWLKSE